MSDGLTDIESLENKLTDLPYWLFDEHPSTLRDEKSLPLSVTKEKANMQLVQNIENEELIFKNNDALTTAIKLFMYLYQILKFIYTTLSLSIKQYVMPEQKSNLLSKATLRVENLNNIMEELKTYATKAEQEHDHISSHFKNMKNQINNQEEILNKNMEQINNLKERVYEADINTVRQNKMIESLENELEIKKNKLLNAETKLKGISEQLSSTLSLKTTIELGQLNEADEDYIFIIDDIQEMKIKIQQQENQLANVLQLTNKLYELHDVNQSINKQTKAMIDLKDGLRRKSATLFENLKSAVGHVSESTVLNTYSESEDFQEYDKSLTAIQRNTRSFLEDVNTKFELLKDRKIPPKELSSSKGSEIFQQNLNSTVIQCSTPKMKNLISSSQKEVVSLTTRPNKIATFEKGIQASIKKVECIDTSCQTTGSVADNDTSSVSKIKSMMQNTLQNFNSVQMRQDIMKEMLDAYKSEKDEVEKSRDKSINELKIEIIEKDSKIDALTKELHSLEDLKKENEDLKESLDTAKEENKSLKDQITKASLLEQGKNKRIADLEQDIKVTKQTHEQNIAYLKKESDNMSNDFILLNLRLTTEKENIKNLKQHYKHVNQHLQEEVKTYEQSILTQKVEYEMLMNTCDSLNTKIKEMNIEFERTIRKKEETILFHKLANKGQTTEIKKLKEEIKRQGEKEKYSRTALQENMQNRRYNAKENNGSPQTILKRTYPHLQSNITYRTSSTDRKKL